MYVRVEVGLRPWVIFFRLYYEMFVRTERVPSLFLYQKQPFSKSRLVISQQKKNFFEFKFILKVYCEH